MPPSALQDGSTVFAVREIKTPHPLTTHLESIHSSLDNESILPFRSILEPSSLTPLSQEGLLLHSCRFSFTTARLRHTHQPHHATPRICKRRASSHRMPSPLSFQWWGMRRKLLLCAPFVLGGGSIPAGASFFPLSFVPHLIHGWSRDDIVNRSSAAQQPARFDPNHMATAHRHV